MDDADLDVILRTVRDLVRERVIPREAEIDATDEMPAGLREEAARMGLFGFAIPEEYGGAVLQGRAAVPHLRRDEPDPAAGHRAAGAA
jgi:alkylation response protein AidB-like acyl-CoA dehydrogenase